ncbi:MAG: N-acetylmuramoyl-L-alanine amidase [Oscillospiraceae bacterium]
MSLQARTDFANKVKADCFISCHRNSYILSIAYGAENWVYKNTNSATLSYASDILNEIVKVGVQANRGVKKGNFHVCRETNMMACLLELGFIKNAKDNALYDSKFNMYVEAVTKGICKGNGLTYTRSDSVVIAKPVEKKTYYKLEVFSFKTKEAADKVKQALNLLGPYAETQPHTPGFYKVVSYSYETRERAEEVQKGLKLISNTYSEIKTM